MLFGIEITTRTPDQDTNAMPTESKSPIDQFEQKFQCMVHELRNDTDWVNLKRTIVRAPQILKQKFKATDKTHTDEEYATAYEQFQAVDEGLCVLEKNILSSLYHFKQMLDHSIAMCDAISKVFDPNLESSIATDAKDDGAVKNGYDKFVAVTRFASKLREIQANAVPNLELIINNVREPVTKILAISKNIKKSVKEREFALLDMNRYADHLSTLNGKDKSTLTLKQEQNIIRYDKNLELATLKLQKINEQFKNDLPRFTELVFHLMKPLLKTLYFLQLTIHYQLLDLSGATDDHFKLRTSERDMDADAFGHHVSGTFKKKHKEVKEKVEELEIIKSALERSVKQQMESLSLSPSVYDMASLAKTEPMYCIAKFSFEGEQKGDLSFRKGDKILILDEKTLDGDWWRGELNGQTGIFPRNYVTI